MSNELTLGSQGDRILVTVPRRYRQPLSILVSHLRQQLPGLAVDWVAVREAYRFGRGRPFPIASRDPEAAHNEKAKIRFSADDLTAYLLLFPPKPRGQRLAEGQLGQLLRAYGIPGELLDEQAARLALLRRAYGEAEPIARGRPPVDGEPAHIAWLRGVPTDPEGFLAATSQLPEYPDPVLVEATPGSTVGTRHAPGRGRPGISARGEEIPARPGSDPIWLGPGLEVGPDGSAVLCSAGGHLRLQGPGGTRAEILPLLRISDPLALRPWAETVYPGSVVVEGDLELSFPVRVLGDMEVRGGVIRSPLEVMGSLFVRDGVIQQRHQPLRVGGMVSAGFLERAAVEAGVIHVRRYSLKSQLTALEALSTPPDAALQGGHIQCCRSISVGVLGSDNGLTTEVVVGAPNGFTPFQDLFESWVGALREAEAEDEVTAGRLGEQADALEARAAAWEAPELGGLRIEAGQVHPGVSVRLGSAVREIQGKIGPVAFWHERIGPHGRVALTRG